MSELERIFLAALELPEPQRDAFITNECGQNHALARDVQSLLSHHRQETIPFSEILLLSVRALKQRTRCEEVWSALRFENGFDVREDCQEGLARFFVATTGCEEATDWWK